MNSVATILLVDDVAANRETLLELLESKDFRLVEAANGPEALKLAAESRPDLVLLDVMMPGMDGYEVCRRLRADARLADLPVIMITSLDDQQSRLAGIEAGADDFITKPFNRMELRTRVRTITRLNRYRRMAEAQERIFEQAALLDQARDAIIVSKLNGLTTYWNQSAGLLFDLPEEDANGRPLAGILQIGATTFTQARDQLLEKGEWSAELGLSGNGGRAAVIDSRWTLLRDTAGKPKGVMTINSDITEKSRAAAQSLRTQRMESIGTLAGGIAHDLNNLLAPILMSIELLKEDVTSDDGRVMLETLQRSAQRGADLVQQVLSFSRGAEGEHIVVNLAHILREIQNIIREIFPKNITFQLDCARDLRAVAGDPTQLHQVFMNLFVNARDAMPSGGRLTVALENVLLDELFVRMNPTAKTGSYVLAKVTDTGSGIPPAILDKIFEPFFSTKEIGKGTGLGLSTTLSIVKSHGGFILIRSELEKGTEFAVYFPACEQAGPGETTTKKPAFLPAGNDELALVVDDESAVRSITHQTLEMYGYRALSTSDGAEALAIFGRQSREIQVVLTDLSMPILDGPALIAALRRIEPTIKIIVATGGDSGEQLHLLRGLGIDAILQKPYTAKQLLETLDDVLRGHSPARGDGKDLT